MDARRLAQENVEVVVGPYAEADVPASAAIPVAEAAKVRPLHHRWIHFKEVKPWRIRLL